MKMMPSMKLKKPVTSAGECAKQNKSSENSVKTGALVKKIKPRLINTASFLFGSEDIVKKKKNTHTLFISKEQGRSMRHKKQFRKSKQSKKVVNQ